MKNRQTRNNMAAQTWSSQRVGQAGRIRLVLSLKHELSRAAGRAEAVPEEDAQNLMVKVGISITPGA